MEAALITVCVFAFLLAIVVFSPVVITVDSAKRRLRVRWLVALEYLRPLPGASGDAGLYVFRKPVSLGPRPSGQASPAGQESKPPKPRKKRRSTGQFFLRCLGDAGIRRALARQLWKFAKGASRSLVLARARGSVSLPDPAANGMLAGVLAASPWGRRLGMQVNFRDENSLFIEVRFHPHRVFKAFLFSLPGLPYWAMLKQWRAIAAARTE